MNYKEKYNEALERARALRQEAIDKEYAIDYVKDYEAIFPELAESEDVRMIERIELSLHSLKQWINGCDEMQPSRKEECITEIKEQEAWLEKQKENPKSDDFIPSNCVSDAKCEDRSPKHSDSDGTDIRDTPAYWCGWDDAMKQKEQKPVDYDHEMWKNCEANFEGGKKEVIEHPEKYGLQKPVEWDELDKDCLNRAIWYIENPAPSVVKDTNLILWLKSLPGRLNLQPKQEWSEEDIKKIRSEEYTKGFNDAAFGGKLKEWSVEDEDRIRQIERIAQQAGCTQKLQEEIHDWLKSLRSQPKQEWCEEDEKIIGRLRSVVNECAFYKDALDVNGDYCEGDYAKLDAWLKSLPLNLKKKNDDVAKLCSNEWSESDKQNINLIISYLDSYIEEHNDTFGADECKSLKYWLKSLPMKCPKSSDNWKPSEDEEEEPEYYQHFDPDC